MADAASSASARSVSPAARRTAESGANGALC
jgi:hypothetical protein